MYYSCSELSEGNIVFVDTPALFADMLGYFEQAKPDVVGLDCEWKPIFDVDDSIVESVNDNVEQHNKKNRPSTLQIATRHKVFVVETKHLVDVLDEPLLHKFGELILFSERLVKLGYGFDQDGKKLANSFTIFKYKFANFVEDVVNMDVVASECAKMSEKVFDTEAKSQCDALANSSKPKGLSKLTMICLGKPLDKRECMSNWDNKPLRRAQLIYAALDALVLIKIHEFIQNKCKELNINFNYTNKSLV